MRRNTVVLARWLHGRGHSLRDVAARIPISHRTLCKWLAGWRRDRLAVHARGRPVERLPYALRLEILTVLRELGGVGVPTLQAMFPRVERRALEEILRRWRRVSEKRYPGRFLQLEWKRAGAAWAMDFTQPPNPIEAIYERILLIRDLASGDQVEALPLPDEQSEGVIAALRGLFHQGLVPLVLKADGGGAFTSDAIRAFLEEWGVALLTSPPRMPRYNGAIEAGVGSLKTRAHHHAAKYGREGHWSLDDVEAARLQANEIGRPNGPTKPTPGEAFAARRPITAEERTWFQYRLQRIREDIRRRSEAAEGGILPLPGGSEHAKWERAAISKALQDFGLFRFQRGRVSPRISRRKRARIT